MNVHYKGKLEPLESKDQKKLDARFQKLGKLLDRKSEKEAHVIFASERHVKRAEITVNYYDHSLCGVHEAPETLSAFIGALDKLEKQILKLQAKRREPRRGGKKIAEAAPSESPAAAPPEIVPVKIYNGKIARKPMSADEAAAELDGKRTYLAYRDAATDRISVLVRRPDGNLDLIEAN